MARFQRRQVAEDVPEVIAHPEAARGLDHALIDALVGCFGGNEVYEDKSAQRNHSLTMRWFRRAVEGSFQQPLYIPELCASIGVGSDIKSVLPGAVGDEPQAIPAVAPDVFGRFAGEYKGLFGEAPSTTLHRPHE